jgi:hypothetical protein
MSNILLIIFILGTVAALVVGIIFMMRGGDSKENGRMQNRLMQYRIYFQAAAIGVLVLVMAIGK